MVPASLNPSTSDQDASFSFSLSLLYLHLHLSALLVSAKQKRVCNHHPTAMAEAEAEAERKWEGHVVLFPAFGMGHFLPMVELATRLNRLHAVSVTLITTQWLLPPHEIGHYRERLMAAHDLHINFLELPSVDTSAAAADYQQRMDQQWQATTPLLRQALLQIKESGADSGGSPPMCAFVADFFCAPAFDVALELGLPLYVFYASGAALLCVMLHMPAMADRAELPLNVKDHPHRHRLLHLPGLPPMPANNMPAPMWEPSWRWVTDVFCRPLPRARGFILSTCAALEEESLEALRQRRVIDQAKEYYAVGPLVKSSLFESADMADCECVAWLERQPPASVVYVSFGSRGYLSAAQVAELALGLESSGVRFLWVLPKLGPPLSGNDDARAALPEGFEKRSREGGTGMVVTSWAPQVQILRHAATAGFLSHCGWNSTLETILCGVPVLCWPLAAEQHMNAFLLVNEMKVALPTPSVDGDVVGRNDIEKGLTQLMQGDVAQQIRHNMKHLSDAAQRAVAPGGTSSQALQELCSAWKALSRRK